MDRGQLLGGGPPGNDTQRLLLGFMPCRTAGRTRMAAGRSRIAAVTGRINVGSVATRGAEHGYRSKGWKELGDAGLEVLEDGHASY